MESLREYLSSLPFNFQNASIITGQEEGLYGWITVNYLMGNFLEVGHCHNQRTYRNTAASVPGPVPLIFYFKLLNLFLFTEKPLEQLCAPTWVKDCWLYGPWWSVNTDCLSGWGEWERARLPEGQTVRLPLHCLHTQFPLLWKKWSRQEDSGQNHPGTQPVLSEQIKEQVFDGQKSWIWLLITFDVKCKNNAEVDEIKKSKTCHINKCKNLNKQ